MTLYPVLCSVCVCVGYGALTVMNLQAPVRVWKKGHTHPTPTAFHASFKICNNFPPRHIHITLPNQLCFSSRFIVYSSTLLLATLTPPGRTNPKPTSFSSGHGSKYMRALLRASLTRVYETVDVSEDNVGAVGPRERIFVPDVREANVSVVEQAWRDEGKASVK